MLFKPDSLGSKKYSGEAMSSVWFRYEPLHGKASEMPFTIFHLKVIRRPRDSAGRGRGRMPLGCLVHGFSCAGVLVMVQ